MNRVASLASSFATSGQAGISASARSSSDCFHLGFALGEMAMRSRPSFLRSRFTSRGELLRSRRTRRARRLFFEPLEDRRGLATDITVIAAGVGTLDAFLTDATPGTIEAADNAGVAGTVSKGALEAVGA